MSKKNFNEVLKEREMLAERELLAPNRNAVVTEEGGSYRETKTDYTDGEAAQMALDSTERVKVLSPGQMVFKRFINNKLAIVGSAILAFMFIFSFLVPIVYPYSQTQIFYKYDNSIIDYAIASERTDFSLLLLDENTDIHYSVKNNLTSVINKIAASGDTEATLEDNEGIGYLLNKESSSVYSLYQASRNEVCSISGETKYATYNSVLKDVKLAAGAESVEGMAEALQAAVDAGKTEFVVEDTTYRLEMVKRGSYNVFRTGSGINYTDKNLGSAFETALGENIENKSFEVGGKTYSVVKDNDVIHVYESGDKVLLGYLTNYVFDSYDDAFVVSDEFKISAIEAYAGKGDFSVDGVDYTVVKNEEESLVYGKNDMETPVAAFSNLVVRAYSGEDNLGFAFKEKVHEVIAGMEESNVKKSAFEWEIPQVDSNGEYTLDENGNPIAEVREITVSSKQGSYVMSCEQVVYLIDIFAGPSKEHIFGTDGDGMDVFARMMYGGRVSLLVAFVVVILETILGVIMGGIAGFFGGWVDNLIMRMVDVFYCIPSMPILIIMGALFDAMKMKPYTRVMWLMVVLGILGWAGVARLVRGQILSLREQEFMVAAEAIGLKNRRRIFKHLVPNVMPQLIVTATSGLGSVILTESTLSFLGLGVKHPLATWGTMINSVSTAEAMKSYTYIWIPVGMLICLTVIAFNFVGDGLRDAFDPKMKR